jgi:hypothetical protein
VKKYRRRSAQQEEPAAAEAAQEPPAEEQPTVGRLSGHLPAGTVRGSGEIRTEAGRYLRATARDDTPARFGSPAGEVDDAARAVWKTAFGLAVARRFDPDSPLAEISRSVAVAVHDHSVAALPLLDAEMLVRDALGETVPTDGIDPGVLIAVHLLVFASLADELALGDGELDGLISEAEEKAAGLVPAAG